MDGSLFYNFTNIQLRVLRVFLNGSFKRVRVRVFAESFEESRVKAGDILFVSDFSIMLEVY